MKPQTLSYKEFIEDMLGEGGFVYIARCRKLAEKGIKL